MAITVAASAGVAVAQEDSLAPVAEAVRSHDDRLALRRIDALPATVRRAPVARYLAGRLHERLGEHAKAAREWAGIGEGLPPAIAADVARRRVFALARAARCDEALPALTRLGAESGSHASVARALRGRCALIERDLDAAIDMLRAAALEDARDVDTFAVRLDLAEALRQKGERADAAAELRSLLVDRPEHPDVEAALAQLVALGGTLDLTSAERLARAERLIRLRRPADALAEIDAAEPPRAGEERARYLHLRGTALFDTRRNYEEAARVLAQAARLRGSTAPDDEFQAARALSRSEQDDAAIRAYRRFARQHPSHRKAATAEYLAAWLELRKGRAAGRRNMRRFLDGPRASGGLALDAAWDLAFDAYERGRHRDAAELFDRYAQLGSARDAMVRGRGLYWLGRARMHAGDRAAAIAAWRAVLSVEPLHWYALLARERLLAAGEDPGGPFPPAEPRPTPPPLPAAELPADVRLYHRLGLDADAVGALRTREDAIGAAAPEGRGREAIVSLYLRLGAASRPYRIVAIREQAELSRAPDAANRWIWQAAYPRPWDDEVSRVARAEGVPPEQLWAIMRQESGYDPEAVSYADAVGLLQLLPSTAETLARQRGLEVRREMLFDPRWNLRLASAYVGGLMRTFDRRAPLAVGAYNAGGHRMRRWLDDSPDDVELDVFVERIPYDQTRNYVRRVTTHLAKYLYLATPEAGWPLTLLE